mmetsp:Transcript_39787/g.116109  ORF Transcript_39787/g.116109 Transcript_39787/m.116109 type:complete len:274 (-) Transcript_39787:71-892(-)
MRPPSRQSSGTRRSSSSSGRSTRRSPAPSLVASTAQPVSRWRCSRCSKATITQPCAHHGQSVSCSTIPLSANISTRLCPLRCESWQALRCGLRASDFPPTASVASSDRHQGAGVQGGSGAVGLLPPRTETRERGRTPVAARVVPASSWPRLPRGVSASSAPVLLDALHVARPDLRSDPISLFGSGQVALAGVGAVDALRAETDATVRIYGGAIHGLDASVSCQLLVCGCVGRRAVECSCRTTHCCLSQTTLASCRYSLLICQAGRRARIIDTA